MYLRLVRVDSVMDTAVFEVVGGEWISMLLVWCASWSPSATPPISVSDILSEMCLVWGGSGLLGYRVAEFLGCEEVPFQCSDIFWLRAGWS